jgi:rhodanese-related sulfurtransferase
MSQIILDVREADEFNAEHIPNSIHIPLSDFDRKAPAILNGLAGQEILLMCRSGKRAKIAAERISVIAPASAPSVKVYEGGILEWKTKGNPTTCEVAQSRR